MAQQATIKRNIASLVGGIFVAIFAFVLLLLLMGEVSTLKVVVSLLIAGALGVWVRLADL